jgi:hypothetical protein
VEGGGALEVTGDGPGPGGGRLAGTILAGGIGAALAGWALLELLGGAARGAWADAYRRWVEAGGWFWLPLWGCALGAAIGARWVERRPMRIATVLGALALALAPLALRPRVPVALPSAAPRSPVARATAIRRWAFESADGVRRIVPFAMDPSPVLREQAVLALGVNVLVANLQSPGFPMPPNPVLAGLRDTVRTALERALRDSVEAVRAEAARALWKAPRAFGAEPAAAETLAAVLDRAPRTGMPERLAWLALDAAAGDPDPALKAAARRFAARTKDRDLAAAARKAAR